MSNRLIFIFINCISLSFFCPIPAQALGSLQDHIVEKFITHANKELEEGRPQEAIDNFSNALLLDSRNAQAREALLRIKDSEVLASQLTAQLTLFEDLSQYLNNLRAKVDYYRDVRNVAGEKLINERKVPQKDLVIEMKKIQEDVIAASPKIQFKRASKNIPPLEALNEMLAQEKQKLLIVLSFVKAQQERLRQLDALAAQKPLNKNEFKNDLASSKPVKILPLPVAAQNIDEKISSLEEKVKILSEELNSKNSQLARLSDQIVSLSLELSEKDAVAGKAENITVLSQEMMELESRLSLGEKIIQEKDTEIQALKMAMQNTAENSVYLRMEMEKMASANKSQLSELVGFLEIYKAKLTEAAASIKINARELGSLREQLLATQAQVFEKDVVLEKINSDLNSIAQSVVALNEKGVILSDGKSMDDELATLQNSLKTIRSYLAKKVYPIITGEEMLIPTKNKN